MALRKASGQPSPSHGRQPCATAVCQDGECGATAPSVVKPETGFEPVTTHYKMLDRRALWLYSVGPVA